MSIRTFEPSRAVEVIASQYGSGYRIGGRLVLTASHLLGEVGTECTIKNKKGFEEKQAKVVWKAPKDTDVALVELPEENAEVEPITLGQLPEGKAGENISFQMYGYPRWGWMEGNQRPTSSGLQVEGKIYLEDTPPLVLRIDENLVSEYLADKIIKEVKKDNSYELKSEWGAMSGAAVVCDGLVVAVQKQHSRPMQPNHVAAAPLWTIYGDEQWQHLLEKHGIKHEPEIACLQPPLSQSVWQELFGKFENFFKQFSSEAIFSKDYKDLLDKVENKWVKPTLRESFYNQDPIQLSLEQRLDLVELVSPEQPEQLRRLLPKGTRLTSIFNDLGRAKSLLILGQPGSGKTMALLELTQSLIKESKQTSNSAVPIFLNLSSWTDTSQSLDLWLLHQLDIQYKIRNKSFVKALIQKRETIFVLDGLDEVRQEFQASCIHAINRFISDHTQVSIVVGSRLQDYEQHSLRLEFRSAVCIQALRFKEVNQYLRIKIESLESVKEKSKDNSDLKEKITQLTAVKGLLYKDVDLQQIIDTPLILSIIFTVAGSQTPFKSILRYGSIEERRQKIFDAYITKVLTRRKSDKRLLENQEYKEEDVKRWLCWLASYMNQKNSASQTEFRIEELWPHCLETNVQRLNYRLSILSKSFFIGLQCGTLTGIVGFFAIPIVLFTLSYKADAALISEITITHIILGVTFSVFTGLLLGLLSASFKQIKTVKTRTFSLDTIFFRWQSFFFRLAHFANKTDGESKKTLDSSPTIWEKIDVLVVILISIFLVFNYKYFYYAQMFLGSEKFIKAYEKMIASGGTMSDETALYLTLTLTSWFLLGLETSEGSKKIFPGQGILESQRASSIVLWCMAGVIQPIYFFVLIQFIRTQPQFLAVQSVLVAVTITIATFWCGGITKIQHYALRNVLSNNNFIPHDLEDFLALSAKVLLLKRYGGSYGFFHPLLQKHFLEMSVDSINPDTDT
jgi:DNA polymerase III delta prime subunit